MTVRPGEPWGHPGPLAEGAPVCETDREVADAVADAVVAGRPPPTVGLRGGDLWRTLGAPPSQPSALYSSSAITFPIDVLVVHHDGGVGVAVAHAVARRPNSRGGWLRGPVVAAMNAETLGDWIVAPRAHPGDGRVDVVVADPPLADRWRARRRLLTASHVPHPDIGIRRVERFEHRFGHPVELWCDGRSAGLTRALVVEVHPDAAAVVV